jgi:acetyl esterase/lipase
MPPGKEAMKQARLEEVVVPVNTSDPIFQACFSMSEASMENEGRWVLRVGTPTLVPYVLPADASGRTDAAVVVFPGGGFQFLAMEKEGTDIAEWLNSLGISAFLLKYRVADDSPKFSSLQDAQRAVSLVRSRAEEFYLNASRLGVIGFSAGGMLAAMLAISPTRMYDAFDDVDRASSRPDFVMMIYPAIPQGMTLARAQEVAQRLPVTFMAVGAEDPCCPSELVAKWFFTLKAAGGPVSELHVYAAGTHGYGRCTFQPTHVYTEACAWTINARVFLHKLSILPEL